MPEPVAIDYKTHILVGVRANGAMAIIADWSYVPKQAEMQKGIDEARDGYTTFALCTPTSIIPASNESAAGGWHRPTGPGRR